MEYPLSAAVVPRLEYLDEVGSTNDELAARVRKDRDGWPDFSVVAAGYQNHGRGRQGRAWIAPPGKALAASCLVRVTGGENALPARSIGWIPLLAGVAMTRTVSALIAETVPDRRLEVALKWPNDVLVSELKVSGILTEFLSGGMVVIGSGVNLTFDKNELPVPAATSLSLITGGSVDPDRFLADYLQRLRELCRSFHAAAGDAMASGLRAAVTEVCGTLGRKVRITFPDQRELHGVATGLSAEGRLLVRSDENDRLQTVAAGDVTHLRY